MKKYRSIGLCKGNLCCSCVAIVIAVVSFNLCAKFSSLSLYIVENEHNIVNISYSLSGVKNENIQIGRNPPIHLKKFMGKKLEIFQLIFS
jgi:hypothetical protein